MNWIMNNAVYVTYGFIAVALFGALAFINTSAYDARDELAVFAPRAAALSLESSLQSPTLTTPTLESPTLEAPELESPTLESPTLETPSLETPTLETPSLETPTLETPTLETPTLETPTLETPDLDSPQHAVRTCNISANVTTVNFGGSVTLEWTTKNFDSVTLNGETVQNSGSKTFTNITQDTTYRLVAKTQDGSSNCVSEVKIICIPDTVTAPLPKCESFSAHPASINKGSSTTLTWNVSNATKVVINQGIGEVTGQSSKVVTPLVSTGYALTVFGKDGKKDTCQTHVTVHVPDTHPVFPTCPLEEKAGRTIVNFDGERIRTDQSINDSRTSIQDVSLPAGDYKVTLVGWDGYVGRENATQPNEVWKLQLLTNGTEVALSNASTNLADKVREAIAIDVVNQSLTIPAGVTGARGVHPFYPTNASPNSLFPVCAALDFIEPVTPDPLPTCESFTASPSTIAQGDSTTLSWTVSNATRVVINQGIGEVTGQSSKVVTPLNSISYTMTVFGADDNKVTCSAPVKVEVPEPVLPSCEFSASPSNFGSYGGTTVLSWSTTNADTVSIDQGIGGVSVNGSRQEAVSSTKTFTLNATNDDGSVECTAKVMVADPGPQPITCEANVDFRAQPSSINRGNSTNLKWNTTNITAVEINQGIGTVAVDGEFTVSPNNTTTYTLTATDGDTTITCPTTVTVSVPPTGGGGGSVSPRCELSVSATRVDAGERVTLSWNGRNVSDIEITDDRGQVLVTTRDRLFGAKSALFSGTQTVRPTRTTEYTMVAERGSRTDICTVRVNVQEDQIIVQEVRDQQPLVAGIALTEVPYTGFEAGPILTTLFYMLLIVWALFVSYVYVRRQQMSVVDGASDAPVYIQPSTANLVPPTYSKTPVVSATTATASIPANLPTTQSVASVAWPSATTDEVAPVTTSELGNSSLEGLAHAKQVLVSSDAIDLFVSHNSGAQQSEVFETVLDFAIASFPAEDGWVVLNVPRMQTLLSQ